ncbi:MAG TPA: aspartate carbamoyltransferase [Gammaproteobacteria bacterium]|jgi:hypothetical protein
MRQQAALVATFLGLFVLTAAAAPTAPFNAQDSDQVFQMSQSGGIQQVTAKDPKDKALIAAIRAYLESQADRFGGGDYSGPLKIEGKDIPTAQYLKAIAPGQMSITYRNVGAGAAIDYMGKDAATVAAIHNWFDALLSDDDE